MDQRLRFVAERLAGEVSMTELCEAHGISRRVGYKWLARYAAEGPAGLAERSHAPLRHGRETPADLVEKIVDLRRTRPQWGPRKIVARLEHLHPDLAWPSHSTAHEILKRAGLVSPRRPKRRVPPGPGALVVPERPNHVWAVDHKGWFELGDGGRCEPLTVADSYSRFLLAVSAGANTRGTEARAVLERAFGEYGLPDVIRSDNGSPFASTSPTGLTTLSAWWIKLGVAHERIQPGKPQQNGRLERLHRTLLEAVKPPAADREAQRRRFERFRRDYNEERPHEALGQLPPSAFYTPSPRPMPSRLPEPDYPADRTVRRVRSNGEIKWRGDLVYVCQSLIGEPVALEEREHGWRLWFYRQPVGLILPDSQKVLPIHPG
jgi:transposase InsO family protein